MGAGSFRNAVRFAVVGAAAGLAAAALAGCAEAESETPGATRPAEASIESDRIGILIGGEPFHLELALDPATRYRGLSGRASIPPGGGMLFAFPATRPLGFVMRECATPIDVAFIDERGRIVAIHEMAAEPPRGPDESARDYDRRLPVYTSAAPARFAIETAGGRLAALGVRPGQQLVFDAPDLIRRAR